MTTATAPEAEAEATATYDFDEGFQGKLTALVLRSTEFNQRVEGLIDPSYLTDRSNQLLVRIAQGYFDKYRAVPSSAILTTLIREATTTKLVRKDDWPDLVKRVKECQAEDLSDSKFIQEKVGEFARRKALEAAIFDAAEKIDKGQFEKVESIIAQAMRVGLNEETNRYDFWGYADARAEHRQEIAAGRIKPTGITTGHKELDNLLYHKGWGRKELSVLMAPAKAGKSMALIGFALAASMAGFNVCYVTLEVAARIIADRSDSSVSGIKMSDLTSAIAIVKGRVHGHAASAGVFDIYDYPTGSLSPGDLRRLVAKKLAQGVKYDLIVVDYADLMRPDVHSSESRENSRQIYVGLRGVAHEFDAAVLSATQTNREGFKATAGKMEHVAEDINKARTVDLLISLNASEEEKANGESRIYFAASRNQKSDITVRVKTNVEVARYIEKIIAVES